jgi:glycosyltransferase involved in cell wall biosynthesis
MKIVLSARAFAPPFVGGVDVYADRLGCALQRLGHDVSFIAVDPTAEINNPTITTVPDKHLDRRVWRLKFAFSNRPKAVFDNAYDPEMGQAVERILRLEKPDLFIILNFYMITLASVEVARSLRIPIVHIATDFVPVCRRATFIRWDGRPCQVGESIKSCSQCFLSHRVLGRLAASTLGKSPEKMIVRWAGKGASRRPPHPLWLLKPYWNQVRTMEQRLTLLRPLRRKIDLVLAPTRYTLNVFLANGFAPDQVHFLPFGVETSNHVTEIQHHPASHIRFMFIGRLQPYKGAHLLVGAFNNLESPKGAALTVYGTADGHEAYVNQLTTKMASNERVQFGGRIDPMDLATAFAGADYFVLPSTWHENSPLVLLDALQSKTPVIASDIGGVTDMIQDGVNGLLFPMGNQQALQQVLQRVIDQPALLEQLRSGTALFSIDDYAKTLLQLVSD